MLLQRVWMAHLRCNLQNMTSLVCHCTKCTHTQYAPPVSYGWLQVVLDDVWKTSIFFNIDVFKENIDVFDVRCFFFSFFQNISYVKNAFENQLPQLNCNKNLYRFSHFLKNTKNAFKNQFLRVKVNKNSYRILHFLKNKICDIL